MAVRRKCIINNLASGNLVGLPLLRLVKVGVPLSWELGRTNEVMFVEGFELLG